MDNDLDISELEFDYIDKSACYTGNNKVNKDMEASKKYKILNSMLQLQNNSNRIIRQLNAYDASSIIMAEANWMKRNHFNKYMPSKDVEKNICIGYICTVDYGKTYKGEIGYIHPALIVGKKEGKYLIIPMTTGNNWRHKCYHPIENPNKKKHNRQSLKKEGFSKDGVLLLNDAKFISGGRILELHEKIDSKILSDIQKQLLYIMFPTQYSDIKDTLVLLKKKNEKQRQNILNKSGRIKNLEAKCEKLSRKISNLESQLNKDTKITS